MVGDATIVTRSPIAETATSSGDWEVSYHDLATGQSETYFYDSDLLASGRWVEGGLRVFNWSSNGEVSVYDMAAGTVREVDTGYNRIEIIDEFLIAEDRKTNAALRLDPRNPDEVIWELIVRPDSDLVSLPDVEYVNRQVVSVDSVAVSIRTGERLDWSDLSYSLDWDEFRDRSYFHRGAIFISNNGFLARVKRNQTEIWSLETGKVPVFADCSFWGGDYGVLARCDEGRELILIDPEL